MQAVQLDRCRRVAVAAGTVATLVLAVLAVPARGQVRPDPPPVSAVGDTVTVLPAPDYEAGGLHRTLLGDGWRSVWLAPVDVQVFGLDRYAGGVEWTKRGGGNQSITLHLQDDDGWREYIFRSVDKFPEQAMPAPVRGTLAGWVVRDNIASFFPAAPLLVPPFLEAVGLLHVEPILRIMPDDPRLGVYQDTFAGMLGTVEIKPNEAPGDEPGYAGSPKIKGTEEFYNDLNESKAHRLDEREFLAARLVDFLINDPDRTRDNMRWARFGEPGDYRWRPLPIDRDWAFVNAEGWVTALLRRAYPKLVPFGPEYPPIEALTYSSFLLDRRLLQRLTREDFEAVATEVRRAVTDSVIEAVVAEMPARWRETGAADRIRSALPPRREALGAIAEDFYDLLAAEAEVWGTDEPDRATVRRLPDGRVRVTITWPEDHERAGEAFLDRVFLPSETDEVRLHLMGGDDRVRVVGERTRDIVVRVVGGAGDDVIRDEAGGATHLYDAEGDNRLVPGPGARVSRTEWIAPEPTEGLRTAGDWAPDWGGDLRWAPAVDYGDVAGVVVGGGPTWIDYGFRRLPYHWKLDARLLYALGDGSVGARLGFDYRLENSPLAFTLEARAIPFHSFRFSGLGNAAPDVGDAALVPQGLWTVRPAVALHLGWRERETSATLVGAGERDEAASLRPLVGRLDLGPQILRTEPRPRTGSPYAQTVEPGDRELTRVGIHAGLELDRTDSDAAPRRGWRVRASAAGYPAGADLDRKFAQATAALAAYLPLGLGDAHLAFRAGGSAVTDQAPLQHTAWVGGRTTLRGYRWQRYRGDTAAFGSTELRVPVTTVELLIRWNLGVFGLADAGRVWVDGDSPGGWHTGVGGGLWLDAFGQSLSAAYAYGEESRLYLQLGLSY
ncbi:MAG: BamA/TamA family outer membrane protein [Gemmatimonadota bacterium]